MYYFEYYLNTDNTNSCLNESDLAFWPTLFNSNRSASLGEDGNMVVSASLRLTICERGVTSGGCSQLPVNIADS